MNYYEILKDVTEPIELKGLSIYRLTEVCEEATRLHQLKTEVTAFDIEKQEFSVKVYHPVQMLLVTYLAQGYYSGSIEKDYALIAESDLDKVPKTLYSCELDGKHSEVEGIIHVTKIYDTKDFSYPGKASELSEILREAIEGEGGTILNADDYLWGEYELKISLTPYQLKALRSYLDLDQMSVIDSLLDLNSLYK